MNRYEKHMYHKIVLAMEKDEADKAAMTALLIAQRANMSRLQIENEQAAREASWPMYFDYARNF